MDLFGDDPALAAPQPVAVPEPAAEVARGASTDRADGTHRALYLRWRPTTFSDVVGQEHVTRTLRNAVMRKTLAHAYLFTGPRGTGKTSCARILYRAASCPNAREGDPCNRCPLCVAALEGRAMDLTEIDAASNRGIEDIRDLRDRVAYRPSDGPYRVYIIDEAHELTPAAWDAFLKTLEEPPEHIIFVLATTEAHKVPATIVSRCQRFDFRRIPFEATREQLRRVSEAEGLDVDPQVLERLARVARGGLRDALSLLDQVGAFSGGHVDMDVARAVLGLPAVETVRQCLEALGARDGATLMGLLADVSEGGADLRQFTDELVAQLRALLLVRAGSEAALAAEMASEDVAFLRGQRDAWSIGALLRLVGELSTVLARVRDPQQFQVQVELALLSACVEGEVSVARAMDPPRRAPAGPTAPPRAVTAPPVLSPPGAPVQPVVASRHALADAPAALVPSPGSVGGSFERADPGVGLPATLQPHDAPPGTAAPASVVPGPGAELDLTFIRQRWPDVLEWVCDRKRFVGSLLQTAEPVRLESNGLVVVFSSAFNRKRAESRENRALIEEAFEHAFGRRLALRSTADSTESGAPSLLEDPVIKFAAKTFGGQPRRIEEGEAAF
ncbi:MAG: DNA polymerase III subunit gamma/tau [Chloroflexi bacterium]|nr:DNA polymerase III subunit gamma/tau [Chloroflexota bacterium]